MNELMSYLAVFELVVGTVMICLGWYAGVKWKTMGEGLGLIISSVSMIMLGSLILGICGITVVVVLFVIDVQKKSAVNKESKRKKAESIGSTKLDRFFVECVLSDICDFSVPKNKQRAELLADKYKLTYPNGIEELYSNGLEAHKIVSHRFVLNHLEERREEERKQFDELNRYANLVGKEKRITMLSDIASNLRKEAKNQKMYADMLMRSGQQRERDWATWGGIANGIGGFGAGVATAIDVQIQNIQIREENERRRQSTLPAYFYMTDSANGNISNANAIMKEIEEFKMKLIYEESNDILIKNINFSNTDVLVSETGAAMVCTTATLNPEFVIYDDVPAVVDGTIVAKIYEGNTLCGTANLVIPIYGLGQNITLNGICIDCCKPGIDYTVKFVAKNLWAMER